MLSTILAIHIPSITSIVVTLIGLLILWIIISIPVYFGAKLVVGTRARFSQAMIVTLAGPIVFALVLAIGYLLLSKISGDLGFLALILAFLAWIWVFKASFGIGWLHSFALAIVSIIIAFVLIIVMGLLGFAFWHTFSHELELLPILRNAL